VTQDLDDGQISSGDSARETLRELLMGQARSLLPKSFKPAGKQGKQEQRNEKQGKQEQDWSYHGWWHGVNVDDPLSTQKLQEIMSQNRGNQKMVSNQITSNQIIDSEWIDIKNPKEAPWNSAFEVRRDKTAVSEASLDSEFVKHRHLFEPQGYSQGYSEESQQNNLNLNGGNRDILNRPDMGAHISYALSQTLTRVQRKEEDKDVQLKPYRGVDPAKKVDPNVINDPFADLRFQLNPNYVLPAETQAGIADSLKHMQFTDASKKE
jgi:hypothetical protein